MASTSVEHRANDDEGGVPSTLTPPGAEVDTVRDAELMHYNPDAPSEQWGWHGSWHQFAPRGSRILLWLLTLSVFTLLFGNHISNVEDYWLVAFGLGMAAWLVWTEVKLRRNRRRRP